MDMDLNVSNIKNCTIGLIFLVLPLSQTIYLILKQLRVIYEMVFEKKYELNETLAQLCKMQQELQCKVGPSQGLKIRGALKYYGGHNLVS